MALDVHSTKGLPKPGDLVGGKYRIMSSIGAGGMGVVFEAVHIETEASVALKWLNPELSSSPEATERFKFEARATGRIRHPNVVAIHDIAEHGGNIYLVMELLRGCPLRTRLTRGTCDLQEACQILFPVMRGVAAAHAVQVLHRDLKPENIFLAESPDGLDPIPKVLDFGIAKLSVDATISRVSQPTAFMGTYPYMAFEQLHGRKDLDARVDVYALGAVLYTMLTGRLPYEANNAVDLALRMLQAEPEPVSARVRSFDKAIDPVIARALARERDERYATVDDFATALEPFVEPLRYRGTGRTGPVVTRKAAETAATDSADPPSMRALQTPFVVSKGPAKTSSPPPAKEPAKPAPNLKLYAGAAALLLVVVVAITALLVRDSGKTVAKAPPPPPIPTAPAGAKPPAATGAVPSAVDNSDWGAAPDSANPVDVDHRPSGALPPAHVDEARPQQQAPVAEHAVAPSNPTPVRPESGSTKPLESSHRHESSHGKTEQAPQGGDESELLTPDWARSEKPGHRSRSPK